MSTPSAMTAVEITALIGLLMLCFGMLLGSSWTLQALDQQFRRLASDRRELNESRLALTGSSQRCPRCGNLIVSAGSRPSVDGAIRDDHPHAETSRATDGRR